MYDPVHTTRAASKPMRPDDVRHRRLHTSNYSLNVAEFARYHRYCMHRDLGDLVSQCRDRYCYAARLITPCADLSRLEIPSSQIDLTMLYMPWDRLCIAYRCHAFNPQCDLFEAQEMREKDRWHAYRDRCFAGVLREPSYTRCILEHTGLLSTPADQRTTCLDALFTQLIANSIRRN